MPTLRSGGHASHGDDDDDEQHGFHGNGDHVVPRRTIRLRNTQAHSYAVSGRDVSKREKSGIKSKGNAVSAKRGSTAKTGEKGTTRSRSDSTRQRGELAKASCAGDKSLRSTHEHKQQGDCRRPEPSSSARLRDASRSNQLKSTDPAKGSALSRSLRPRLTGSYRVPILVADDESHETGADLDDGISSEKHVDEGDGNDEPLPRLRRRDKLDMHAASQRASSRVQMAKRPTAQSRMRGRPRDAPGSSRTKSSNAKRAPKSDRRWAPAASGDGDDMDQGHSDEGKGGDKDADGESDDDYDDQATASFSRTRSGRHVQRANYREDDGQEDDEDDDDEDEIKPRRRNQGSMGGFVVNDEDGDGDASFRSSRSRKSRKLKRASSNHRVEALAAKRRSKRARRRSALSSDFEDNGEAESTDDEEEEEDAVEDDDGQEDSDEASGRQYKLRQRTKKVDYRLVPPSEPARDGFGRKVRGREKSNGQAGPSYELDGMVPLPSLKKTYGKSNVTNFNGLPLSMSGKDYDKLFGADNDDDSSGDDIPNSRKSGAAPPGLIGGPSGSGMLGGAAGALGGGAALGPDLGAGRDAVGRMKGATDLADVDPLGVNMQVDFNSVGGLDNHVQQLKEMVSLPLLYPEVFQRFKVTPPRGVLFHGPPGTGKTLVARALAASCSSSGQQISFFMRKGADCLSKWVGEAERQLRLLFEEAKNSQPSIIFFDEIDGLAPVRSSKQDQIHASIVSTLLALMDGMDGRGQVVVIGATNRPDSVDPALRRPGRFDREFYFPLPNREARKSIINIHTKEWVPPLEDAFKDKLAEVTKGYGGADLRALCTEAALNAVQRRYPQIYQTSERLELKPETIQVDARDFMMSVDKVVPSSARSSGSSAAPVPEHLVSLLGDALAFSKSALDKVMPRTAKRNPLEEALYEEDGPLTNDGGFGRELLLQSFEKLRVFRPRLVLHGAKGMGQGYIGAALLHHLEGFHVQSLDVATLMGDSTATMEASLVQMFNEAKRHKPSVLFIPALSHWAYTVSESARTTLYSLLEGLSPSEPVLLIAISDGPFDGLPHDIKRWFGFAQENRVLLDGPSQDHRRAYFQELLNYATKAPTDYPDALPRRRRVLEELPKAPPRAPRVPTAAEVRQQAAEDARLLEHLKFRLGPVLAELKKKFPRFKRDVWQEYNLADLTAQFEWRREKQKIVVTLLYEPDSQLLRRLQASSPEVEKTGYLNGQSASQMASTQIPPLSQETVTAGAATLNDAPPSQEQLQAQAQLRIDDPQALSGLAAAMTGDFSTANPPPAPSSLSGFRRDTNGFFVRDLPIWTLNLEKMQKRLYYNGYLTVQDFLEDLSKIVSNAEEAQEVDEERLTRAQQMRNLAAILLDQHIDQEFRAGCERMAERMLKREEEARVETERQRKEQEDKTKGTPGERQSSRLQGKDPETSDAVAVEQPKSPRDTAMNETGQGSDVVRPYSSSSVDMVPDGSLVSSQLQNINWQSQPDTSSSLQSMGPAPQAPVPAIPPHLNGLVHPSHTDDSSVLSPIIQAKALGASAEPSRASTPHPPLTYDAQALITLRSELVDLTQSFSVEQLEQLRAALFDAIWRRRSEWDKAGLVQDLSTLARTMAREVDEFNREEQRYQDEIRSQMHA